LGDVVVHRWDEPRLTTYSWEGSLTDRRAFLQRAAAAGVGFALDLERLLWRPGQRTIFVPTLSQILILRPGDVVINPLGLGCLMRFNTDMAFSGLLGIVQQARPLTVTRDDPGALPSAGGVPRDLPWFWKGYDELHLSQPAKSVHCVERDSELTRVRLEAYGWTR
jgi:hypothetical protein